MEKLRLPSQQSLAVFVNPFWCMMYLRPAWLVPIVRSHFVPAKPAAKVVTNGFSTVLLVFHPYYRSSFEFETGPDELVDGKPAVPVHFAHIPGRRTPAALALRGREYPLELRGTAWLRCVIDSSGSRRPWFRIGWRNR